MLISGLVKDRACLLDLSTFEPGTGWLQAQRMCRTQGRLAPMAPDAFERMMSGGVASGEIRFTSNADLDGIVLPNYRNGFIDALASVRKLKYDDLGWGDAQMATLAGALAFGHAHGGLRELTLLSLNGNKLGPAAAESICELLGGGVLDRLEWLQLRNNGIGDAGHGAFARTLQSSSAAPKLEQLFLTGNNATRAGVQRMREACCRDFAGGSARAASGGKGIYLQLDDPDAEPVVVTVEGWLPPPPD